jgi:hypothetical protein
VDSRIRQLKRAAIPKQRGSYARTELPKRPPAFEHSDHRVAVALYVSDGLIFELYDGGQPHRKFVIRWERLRPTVPDAEENT